jgi:hypothetical protein
MDASDRKGVLRRLIDAESNVARNEGGDRSALRWSLSEPIEESGLPRGLQVADDSPVLLAHAGRSWGP